MCVAAKYNPVGRLLGNAYSKVDPVMAASERDLDKRLTRQFNPGAIAKEQQNALNARINQNNSLMFQPPTPPAQRKAPVAGLSLLGQ